MIFSCSMTEPGHPCVTIIGNAFFMLRTDVNEMNVQPVDLGDELRQGVQFRLAPCASRSPSPSSRASFCIVASCTPCDAIGDRFPLGPSGRGDAPAQLGELRFRNVDVEGADRVVFDRTHL